MATSQPRLDPARGPGAYCDSWGEPDSPLRALMVGGLLAEIGGQIGGHRAEPMRGRLNRATREHLSQLVILLRYHQAVERATSQQED